MKSARHRGPILRRTVLEIVRLFNERTDVIVKWLAIALVLSFLADRFWEVSGVVERVLTVCHFAVAFGVVAYFVGRKILFRDANAIWSRVLTDADCRQIRDWLHTGDDSAADKGLCLTELPAPETIDALVNMNYLGFCDTAFAIDEARLMHRNLAWIKKNPRIFMLMRDPIVQRDFIGYSAMLPLNEDGAELYLAGKLEDSEIPAALVCGPDEKPAAILIFAIVLKPEFSFSRSGASRQYSFYFWSCVRKHVKDLYPELFRTGQYPPLYAQAERSRMKDRLKSIGFKPTSLESADGFELWVLENAGSAGASLALA